MSPEAIVEDVTTSFAGVVAKASWGETALFYNPGGRLPNGVYFCTLKAGDGANDRASRLDRDGVFRLSIGVSTETYALRFGPRPARPAKGGVVNTGQDFAALDVLTPHPVYAWMGWVQVLSPTASSYPEIRTLIAEAHALAAARFDTRLRAHLRKAASRSR
jgi:hypothetical protein